MATPLLTLLTAPVPSRKDCTSVLRQLRSILAYSCTDCGAIQLQFVAYFRNGFKKMYYYYSLISAGTTVKAAVTDS